MGTDVAYVLVLVQVGGGLLAMVGELVFMGSPLYALVPLATAAALVLLAAKVRGGRRWALLALLCFEGLSLLGVGVSLVAGALLSGLGRTVTLAGLLTEIVLPIVVAVLCAQRLALPAPPAAAP